MRSQDFVTGGNSLAVGQAFRLEADLERVFDSP